MDGPISSERVTPLPPSPEAERSYRQWVAGVHGAARHGAADSLRSRRRGRAVPAGPRSCRRLACRRGRDHCSAVCVVRQHCAQAERVHTKKRVHPQLHLPEPCVIFLLKGRRKRQEAPCVALGCTWRFALSSVHASFVPSVSQHAWINHFSNC